MSLPKKPLSQSTDLPLLLPIASFQLLSWLWLKRTKWIPGKNANLRSEVKSKTGELLLYLFVVKDPCLNKYRSAYSIALWIRETDGKNRFPCFKRSYTFLTFFVYSFGDRKMSGHCKFLYIIGIISIYQSIYISLGIIHLFIYLIADK